MWQKIAIARFFYRNAPLVIFDEPTAAIDAVSEYKIFNRITARSFRARLATATYVDSGNNKTIATRAGLFLEDLRRQLPKLERQTAPVHDVSHTGFKH